MAETAENSYECLQNLFNFTCAALLVQMGERVGVRVTEDGYVMFYVNGSCQSRLKVSVTEPLWGVIDVQGRVTKVSIIGKNKL